MRPKQPPAMAAWMLRHLFLNSPLFHTAPSISLGLLVANAAVSIVGILSGSGVLRVTTRRGN